MFSNKPTLYKYIDTHTCRQIDRTDIEKNITTKEKKTKKQKENDTEQQNKTKETIKQETKNKTIMQIFVKVSKLIHDSFTTIITKLYIIAITN